MKPDRPRPTGTRLLELLADRLLSEADQDPNYPTLSRDQQRRNNRREFPVGLLGVQPARIPQHIAAANGMEAEINNEG